MNKYYISKDGYKKLENEYFDIDRQIVETNKKMGESVKRDNDLRENPEFMDLRVKAMYELPQKKENLRKKYQEAIIIEELEDYKEFDGTTVIMGSRVELIIDNEICSYIILGTDEGNLNENILSCEAPMAKALCGQKKGDVVIFNNLNITIKNITRI